MEHYLELYSTQNIVTDTALNALPGLPVIEELDNTPKLEELSIAIDGLACGKEPGKDSIPPEVLKHGKQTILQPLHELLCLCWEQGHIPQDMRGANIVTLYKNKVTVVIATTIAASLFWASLAKSSLGHLDPPAEPCFASLPQVTVWPQSRQVHSGHDLRPPSAAGEVSRAPAAIVPSLCGPHQSFWLGEQKRALQDPPEDWLPSKALGDYHFLSPGHAEYGLLQWSHLQCLPSQQWSKAGLCPCSNTVRDFLLDAVPVCLCRLYRRCLRPDKVRRLTLQHRQTPGSTVSSLTSLDAEISCRIAQATAVMAKLHKRVWGNDLVSKRTKMCIYQAYVLPTLLYGSESWTTYAGQERQLNGFHFRCLRRLLHIRWQDRVTRVRWLTEHAIAAHSVTPSMAQPCTSHGAWSPAKRNPLLRTAGGRPSRGSTAAALQGRHQARLVICTNHHQSMGGYRQSPRYMAAKCQSGGFKGGSERCSPGHRQESGEERTHSLCVCFHKASLRHLQQRLPLQDRATQSYKILPKFLFETRMPLLL